MTGVWEVGPPAPTATPRSFSPLCSKTRSTVSSPKGSAAPLPVPALPAAPGQWSGSPRTRTAVVR